MKESLDSLRERRIITPGFQPPYGFYFFFTDEGKPYDSESIDHTVICALYIRMTAPLSKEKNHTTSKRAVIEPDASAGK